MGPFRLKLARHVAGKDVALNRLREVAAGLTAVLRVRQRFADAGLDLVAFSGGCRFDRERSTFRAM